MSCFRRMFAACGRNVEKECTVLAEIGGRIHL
jgi:hypothetical protein